MYRDIAGRGAVTVVGLAEDLPPRLPPGVQHCLLGPTDPLAREWSVTVLGPRGGATLVALDLEIIDPGAPTLEDGRSFRGRWSFHREHAYREVLRLRDRAGPAVGADGADRRGAAKRDRRTPSRTARTGGRSRCDSSPKAWTGPCASDLVAQQALAAARDDATERDPRTGLYTESYLARWTVGLGGALPIGLALLRVSGLAELRERLGLRAELSVVRGVLTCVQHQLGPGDRVVRVGPEDLLLVLPLWTADRVWQLCEQACASIPLLDQCYPFVPLPTVAVATMTRARPLPVDQLRQQAERSTQPGMVSALTG